MNLIADAGNTVLKAALCEGVTLGKTFRYQGEKRIGYIEDLCHKLYPKVLVYCSARVVDAEDVKRLEACASKLVLIDPLHKEAFADLDVPSYLTPDAMACIKAARHMFMGQGCSIFDFGTTLSSIFLDEKGAFIGSAISPGCTTRFRSISRYARNLPLLSESEDTGIIGHSLEESIKCGVVSGIVFEVESYISNYPQNINIFTGGDANYFVKRSKSPIFVACNLVLMGIALIAFENENI